MLFSRSVFELLEEFGQVVGAQNCKDYSMAGGGIALRSGAGPSGK
jgi:hypothetical protein